MYESQLQGSTHIHPKKTSYQGASADAKGHDWYLEGQQEIRSLTKGHWDEIYALRSNASKALRLESRINSTISWVDCTLL